jgi:hypothetical protein
MVLAGAMAELGHRPVIDDWVETYIFQSDKCFASFAVNWQSAERKRQPDGNVGVGIADGARIQGRLRTVPLAVKV